MKMLILLLLVVTEWGGGSGKSGGSSSNRSRKAGGGERVWVVSGHRGGLDEAARGDERGRRKKKVKA